MEHVKQQGFGLVSAMSKRIPAFYADNSFSKKTRSLSKQVARGGALLSEVRTVSSKREQLRLKNLDRKDFEDRIARLTSAVERNWARLITMNQSALVIQRCYRAYRALRQQDSEVVELKKNQVLGQLREHKEMVFDLNFHIGTMPDVAATTLQRAVKRFLFARKIARIQNTYEYILNEKMYIAFGVIRKVVYSFQAKRRVKWKLFKIFRAKRIVQHRERLAVLQIKKIWQQLKLNYRLMSKRIRRFKRHLQKLQEKAEALENPPVEGEEPVEAPVEVEVVEDEDEDSEEELMREQRELERKLKVELGKIAYKIPKEHEKTFLPYLVKKKEEPPPEPPVDPMEALMKKMQEAPVEEVHVEKPPALEIPEEYLHLTERLFDKKGFPTFPLSDRTAEYTHNYIRKLGRKGKKKKGGSDTPGYLGQTASSKRNRKDFEPVIIEELPEIVPGKRIHSTLMSPTRAYILKKAEKHEREELKHIWRPSTVVKEKFMASVENSTQKDKAKRRDLRPARLKPLNLDLKEEDGKAPLPPEPEIQMQTPFSLTFQAALPQISNVVAHYSKPLVLHTKPRTAVMKGR